MSLFKKYGQSLAIGTPTLSLEAQALLEVRETGVNIKPIYLIFCASNANLNSEDGVYDGDSYNHVSISLDNNPQTLFTFKHGSGLTKESVTDLEGMYYSLYAVFLPAKTHGRLVSRVESMVEDEEQLTDTHKALIGEYFKEGARCTNETNELIGSRLIAQLFTDVGIKLFEGENKHHSPYELVKSKLLKFMRRGIVKVDQFKF